MTISRSRNTVLSVLLRRAGRPSSQRCVRGVAAGAALGLLPLAAADPARAYKRLPSADLP